MAPWLVGFGLYGLVVGVAAGRAGVPALAGWLTAPVVYSGGAQVAAIDLLDAGAAGRRSWPPRWPSTAG